MKKDEIFDELQFLDDLGVDRESYTVVYGAAMVLLDIKKETRDIDIYMEDEEMFQSIIDEGYEDHAYKGVEEHRCISIGDIDIFLGRQQMETDIFSIKIAGYQVQSPASLLMEKLARNREKDKLDVQLICNYIDSMYKLNKMYQSELNTINENVSYINQVLDDLNNMMEEDME